MCAVMINPVLSLLFDLFLIGSTSTIIAGMVQEYLASRTVSVGSAVRSHDYMPRADATRIRRRPVGAAPRQRLHRVA